MWPNLTEGAGVAAPITLVSLEELGDNGETSARLEKHLRSEFNSAPR